MTIAAGYLRVTDVGLLLNGAGPWRITASPGWRKICKRMSYFLFPGFYLSNCGVFLPYVQTLAGVFADIYLFQRD